MAVHFWFAARNLSRDAVTVQGCGVPVAPATFVFFLLVSQNSYTGSSPSGYTILQYVLFPLRSNATPTVLPTTALRLSVIRYQLPVY